MQVLVLSILFCPFFSGREYFAKCFMNGVVALKRLHTPYSFASKLIGKTIGRNINQMKDKVNAGFIKNNFFILRFYEYVCSLCVFSP